MSGREPHDLEVLSRTSAESRSIRRLSSSSDLRTDDGRSASALERDPVTNGHGPTLVAGTAKSCETARRRLHQGIALHRSGWPRRLRSSLRQRSSWSNP